MTIQLGDTTLEALVALEAKKRDGHYSFDFVLAVKDTWPAIRAKLEAGERLRKWVGDMSCESEWLYRSKRAAIADFDKVGEK